MQITETQFNEAVKYLYRFIPKTDMNRFPGEYGLKRTKLLLSFLDNPQEKLKVVHIAGTSGKGSTAVVISKLLEKHGFKVGLHIKPHLKDIRERFQINNSIISREKFYSYLQDVKNAVEKMSTEEFGMPTYFEVVVSLAFYIFYKEKVDYAVVETGVGGLYDGSNVIENPKKLVLLTSIGFDHMGILGNTLEEIAYQKAKIMKKGNDAFSIDQKPEVKKVFEKVSQEEGIILRFITSPANFSHIATKEEKTVFDFYYENIFWEALELHLNGDYQAENTSLALAGLLLLADRDSFEVKESIVRETLRNIAYQGRFEIRKTKKKTLVIDGAHNTQKMKAFLSSLTKIFPEKKYTFLLGFKEGKEIAEMLAMITPLANKIYISEFFNDQVDFVAISEKAEKVAELVKDSGIPVSVLKNSKEHISDLLNENGEILVITGSLYLIGDIYPALEASLAEV